jgi:flavin-dependent dehydrogenase
VLVVGVGPSGLSAAYHLARMGHSVTIKDAGAAADGMMRYGIPKYRLPRDILDAEITRILDMGITLELNTTVTDIQAELETEYDAAFVAAGAHIGRRAYIPAGDSARIMDAARTARRLASEAVIMRWLSTVARADEGKLVIEKMKLDETGFPQPTGEFTELEADCLVLALGQNADLSVLDGVPGVTFSEASSRSAPT